MNKRMTIAVSACVALSLVDARAGALKDSIRTQDYLSQWLVDNGYAERDSDVPAVTDIPTETGPKQGTEYVPAILSGGDSSLVTKTRIGSDDVRPGTSVDQSVQQPTDSTTTDTRNVNSGTGASGLSKQDILNMSTDELMNLIRSAGSDSSSDSGSDISARQNDNGSLTFYDLDRSNLLDLTGNVVVSLIQQAVTGDAAVKRKQSNRQRWSDYVDHLYTNPLAVVMPQDKSIDTLETDDNKRWKLFLHDYDLLDFSEIGGSWRTSSVGTESVSRESIGAMSGGLVDSKGDVVGTVQLTTSNVMRESDGDVVCDLAVQWTDLDGNRTVTRVEGVSTSELTLDSLGLNAARPPATFGGVQPAGAFEAPKATTVSGVLLQGGEPFGVLQAKVGKVSKKGESKVSVTVIGLDGKKYTAKAVKVPVGGTPEVQFEVKKLGTLTLTFGANGFSGSLNGAVATSVEGKSATIDGAATFAAGDLSSLSGVLAKYLPTGEVVTRTEKKWTVKAKAGKLKYVKPNEKKNIAGGLQATGSNIAGLKLTYAAKTQTFKGSFKVWTFDEAKKKLKSTEKCATSTSTPTSKATTH